jgi:hypothetical protein
LPVRVLAGVCLFERQIHYLTRGLDDLAAEICPDAPDELEFHGSHMLPGKGFWRSIPDKDTRRKHLRHALAEVRKLHGNWALFGVVVDKAAVSPEDPIEFAFEQLCIRFDAFLKREFRRGNKQRGLIILDKSTRETRLQSLATEFGKSGHRYGIRHSLADVPMFVDSRATRAIQYADLVSYALWQQFERGESAFFRVIDDAFDSEGGIVHGLLHKKASGMFCDCPYCCTRGGRLL